MRKEGMKAFWLAFWITLAVLTPLIGVTLLTTEWERETPAASSKSDVRVKLPGADNRLTVLLTVADDPPDFMLLYLDASENVFRMAAIPAQSVVKNGQTNLTLAESYAAAGPARASALLGDTLGISIDRYLALTPTTLASVFGEAGTASAGLSGALTAQQLEHIGIDSSVRDWGAAAAHTLLQQMENDSSAAFTPVDTAAARSVLWQAFARQKLDRLPALVPAGLRAQSGSLLTNLSATDLLTLGETLEFLANGGSLPESSVLPGNWNAAARRYEFDDATLAAVQAFFNASASAGASSGSSAP